MSKIVNKRNLKNYWNSFYVKKKKDKPSNFAKFIKNKFIKKKSNLIDLGCGDGRDTFYLYSSRMKTLGIDKSEVIIKKNNDLVKTGKLKNLNFKSLNVFSEKIKKMGKFDYIYSRFFLHTINEKQQRKLFTNTIPKISKKNSLCFFEFRTIKDDMYKYGFKKSKYERITDHYRRFIDLKEFINLDYLNKNFKIMYLIERKNLSIYKKDNPVVCRLILKRK
mgnify:FL=1|tara:strand:+ start:4764 stop:5423 length:660 start_codon:yes stop_codon:yes gene_type:complete